MRRVIVGTVLAALFGVAPVASADGRYVALGDSVAAPANSYVWKFPAAEGLIDVHNLAQGGATTETVRAAQLPSAIDLIEDPTDTHVVTITIGGNDYLSRVCDQDWNRPSCPYADKLDAILTSLRSALDGDPGDERLLVMGYYNPASGRGTQEERDIDRGLRGDDDAIDGIRYGDDWGMTDVIGWLACRRGGTLVDAWKAFKAGGQALMGDNIHPNDAGHAVLAELFRSPATGGPTPACPPTPAFATTLSDVGDGTARGIVEPRLAPARWWFEYGPTTDYGQTTEVRELPASAGSREVTATLPAGTFHARLITENAVGRWVGEDRLITGLEALRLTASVPAGQTRQRIIDRGVALRVQTNATAVRVTGKLKLPRRDRTIIEDDREWTASTTQTIRYPLHRSARRLVRQLKRPTLVLKVSGARGTEVTDAIRLLLRPR